MNMFCYQCEQTTGGTSCSSSGNCGKDATTAALQDLLTWVTLGVGMYEHRARATRGPDLEIDLAVVEALFTTVTNVNFDPERLVTQVAYVARCRDKAKARYEASCAVAGVAPEALSGPATFTVADSQEAMILQGLEVGIQPRLQKLGADLAGLQELLMYGMKGTAAYAHHAWVLGSRDESVVEFFYKAMDYLTEPNPTIGALYDLNMECGQINLKVMALLDAVHTTTYGHPVPTPVRIEPIKGKAILVSGHDLKDLEALLEQTAGKGIHVYTHGEMLPAHSYPGLKKYSHLVGNYGGAWQDQREEFDAFPGAILMTTDRKSVV